MLLSRLWLATQAFFISWWYSRDMLEKIVGICFVIATVLLAVLLYTTTPAAVGPVGVLVVFALMYMLALGALTFLLFGLSNIISIFSSFITVKKPIRALTLSRSYYFSSVIALAPVMFVGMQSVGGVGGYDVLLVIFFVVIACVYIAKRTG